jgi:hypothetical protein
VVVEILLCGKNIKNGVRITYLNVTSVSWSTVNRHTCALDRVDVVLYFKGTEQANQQA